MRRTPENILTELESLASLSHENSTEKRWGGGLAQRCFETGDDVWRVLDLEARQPGPDDMACLMVTRGMP